MAPDIVAAIPRGAYVVRIVFADGEVRDVDMESILDGAVFEPLRDPTEFAKVYVDPETHMIAWPTGADLDLDVLYDLSLEPAADASRRSPFSAQSADPAPRPPGVRPRERPRTYRVSLDPRERAAETDHHSRRPAARQR